MDFGLIQSLVIWSRNQSPPPRDLRTLHTAASMIGEQFQQVVFDGARVERKRPPGGSLSPPAAN